MNLHYSQTVSLSNFELHKSYTSMNLHYSQTGHHAPAGFKGSYTSMNLHYSQTSIGVTHGIVLSYTSMNLHYSQTVKHWLTIIKCLIPLWIYITLKHPLLCPLLCPVLYLYEFTLLSNKTATISTCWRSYTSMNLHYSQTIYCGLSIISSLIPLWIYITLKPWNFPFAFS